MKEYNKIKGNIGEVEAVDYLKKMGFKILETNFKLKFGEIDIIALDKNVIVFVEVKARDTLAFGRPIEAVDYKKQQKIKKTAQMYLIMKKKPYADVRFDVIEIVGDKIDYIKNAFMWLKVKKFAFIFLLIDWN